jgi:hypothetical protein
MNSGKLDDCILIPILDGSARENRKVIRYCTMSIITSVIAVSTCYLLSLRNKMMTQVVFQNVFLHWVIFAFFLLVVLNSNGIKDNIYVGYVTKSVNEYKRKLRKCCLFKIASKMCVDYLLIK